VGVGLGRYFWRGGAGLSNMRVRVRWFFAGTRGSWCCVDGWCRGDGVVGGLNAGVLVLGILGGGGGGEGRFVFMFFFFGLENILERTFASEWFSVLRQGGMRSCRIMTARSMKIY